MQPQGEQYSARKLFVDRRIRIGYREVIEICLLNFGYRAIGTAP